MTWRFKIISVGWNCADFLLSTLQSIEGQTDQAYDVMIIDDCTTEDPRQGAKIQEWCDARDERWQYRLNTEHKYALRNHVEGIDLLDPDNEDVIVFLDLDGDQFARDDVLDFLRYIYDSTGSYMTYGNYKPVPDMGTSPVCDAFPQRVIDSNTFRQEILRGFCHFNHLRTMKGFIYRSIPRSYFFYDAEYQWYDGGTDYVMMVPALELSGQHTRFIPQVLCHYNHSNPLADYVHRPEQASRATISSLSRPPLQPLAHRPPPPPLFMPAEGRRELLRLVGQRYHLEYFVESGTAGGDTPAFLSPYFKQLYTIELSEQLFQQAAARFAGTNVQCWFGDSTEVMPKVLATVPKPALIWLDGHYSGPGTAHGVLDTPVVHELTAIFTDGRPHVVLLDDARIYDEGPEHHLEPHYHDYPSLTWVRYIADQNNYDYELADDIIRLFPRGA